MEEKYTVKILLLGPERSGRSALVFNFKNGIFLNKYEKSESPEFDQMTLDLGTSKKADIRIFNALSSGHDNQHIPKHNIILFVVNASQDINEIKSNLEANYKKYKAAIKLEQEIWLVGTHLDEIDEEKRAEVLSIFEEVQREINAKHNQEYQFTPCKGVKLVSSKTGKNVKELFSEAARQVIDKQEKPLAEQKKLEEEIKNKKQFSELFPKFYDLLLNSIVMLEAKKKELESQIVSGKEKGSAKPKSDYQFENSEKNQNTDKGGISQSLRLLVKRADLDEKKALVEEYLIKLEALRENLEKKVFDYISDPERSYNFYEFKNTGDAKKIYDRFYSQSRISTEFTSNLEPLVEIMSNFERTTGQFYEKAEELNNKRKSDDTSIFSYWLSQFQRKIIDGIRLLLRPFETFNHHSNFSTVGTAEILKEKAGSKVAHILNKYGYPKQENKPAQNKEEKENSQSTEQPNESPLRASR